MIPERLSTAPPPRPAWRRKVRRLFGPWRRKILLHGLRDLLRAWPVVIALPVVCGLASLAVALWAVSPWDSLRAWRVDRAALWSGQWWKLITQTVVVFDWSRVFLVVLMGSPGLYIAMMFDTGRLARLVIVWLTASIIGSSAALLVSDTVSNGFIPGFVGCVGLLTAGTRRQLRKVQLDDLVLMGGIRVGVLILGVSAGFPTESVAAMIVGAIIGVAWTPPADQTFDDERPAVGVIIGMVAVTILFAIAACVQWPGMTTDRAGDLDALAAHDALEAGDTDRALEALAAGCEKGTRPDVWLLRAETLTKADRAPEGVAVCTEALERFPDWPRAFEFYYLRALNRPGTWYALADLETALDAAPPDWKHAGPATLLYNMLRGALVPRDN